MLEELRRAELRRIAWSLIALASPPALLFHRDGGTGTRRSSSGHDFRLIFGSTLGFGSI
jgi:hypothetical protein